MSHRLSPPHMSLQYLYSGVCRDSSPVSPLRNNCIPFLPPLAIHRLWKIWAAVDTPKQRKTAWEIFRSCPFSLKLNQDLQVKVQICFKKQINLLTPILSLLITIAVFQYLFPFSPLSFPALKYIH